MHFTVENESLAKALTAVKSCIPSRTTIPILSHVAMEAKDNQLSIRSTNMEREAIATVTADVAAPGEAALPGDILVGLARKLPSGGQCEIALKDERCAVKAGMSKYSLRTLPFADFPPSKVFLGEPVAFTVEAKTLAAMLAATVYAVSADKARYYLAGVHLHISGRDLVAVATDGHRLGLRKIEIPKGATALPPIIVPTEAAQLFLSALDGAEGEVGLRASDKLIELSVGSSCIASQLIEGTFPDYTRVVPKAGGEPIILRPYALAEALARASVVYLGPQDVGGRVPAADFTVKGGSLEVRAGKFEKAEELVEIESGPEMSFRANIRYMAEMLARWPEDAAIELRQASRTTPLLATSPMYPEQLHLVMPTEQE